jgi:hypothetical protein
MAVYWMTFRIEADDRYDERYNALIEAIRKIVTKWWVEPTSFLLFESELSIDGVAQIAKSEIDVTCDLCLIGMPQIKAARVVGKVADQDLFKLIDFTKKV